MTDSSYHEAAHAVAAYNLGLPVVYLTTRAHEEDNGRTAFDTRSEGFQKLDALSCAIIKMAGECAERQLAGEVLPKFNWLGESPDADDARAFAAQMDVGDEFQNRDWAAHRTRTLVRNWWPQIEAVAKKLQRSQTLVGAEVEDIINRVKQEQGDVRRTAPTLPKQGAPQLAEVDRQIAAIKGELDQHVNDDPSLWPLRKKLVALHNKRRELIDQLGGGVHR
jgi:hypothetical protein